jgi:two-component system, response regulator FlrC
VRIVASTNRAVTREVVGGRVRPDLYFALNVIAIQIAPLRERSEDILPLGRHFLALHAAETGRSLVLTPDAEKTLLAYSWPGNVRELENVIERAVVMSSSERISTEALMLRTEPFAITEPSAPTRASHQMAPRTLSAGSVAEEEAAAATDPATKAEAAGETDTIAREGISAGSPVPLDGTLQEFLDRAAALRIKSAIDFAKGNRNAAATALGIDRTTLYRLMRRLGL